MSEIGEGDKEFLINKEGDEIEVLPEKQSTFLMAFFNLSQNTLGRKKDHDV